MKESKGLEESKLGNFFTVEDSSFCILGFGVYISGKKFDKIDFLPLSSENPIDYFNFSLDEVFLLCIFVKEF